MDRMGCEGNDLLWLGSGSLVLGIFTTSVRLDLVNRTNSTPFSYPKLFRIVCNVL
jgi:hypothetical protein